MSGCLLYFLFDDCANEMRCIREAVGVWRIMGAQKAH